MDDTQNIPSYAQNDPALKQFLEEYYNLESPEQKSQRLREGNREEQKTALYNFVDKLAMARLKKRMTQQELAQKIGVNQPVISRMENRKTNPNLTTILKICDALDVTLMIQYN